MDNGHLDFNSFTPAAYARFCAELLACSLGGNADAGEATDISPSGIRAFRLRGGRGTLLCLPLYAAKRELKRLLSEAAELPTEGRVYLGTALHLLPRHKKDIRRMLPAVQEEEDILGADDWAGRSARHDSIRKRYPMLMKGDADNLRHLLREDQDGVDAAERELLLQEIEESLRCFALPPRAEEALQRLLREKALIITGEPGIGKTTLAHYLLRRLIVEEGYEPVPLRSDIREGHQALRPDRRQVFLYDDFLGECFYRDHLRRHEDGSIADFIAHLRRSEGKLIILTSREYIFRQAGAAHEAFNEANTALYTLRLHMAATDEDFRAEILHRHLLHKGFSPRRIAALSRAPRGGFAPSALRRIIYHPNFNPRILDTALRRIATLGPHCDLAGRLLRALDNPYELYENAFLNELSPAQRGMLLALATLPRDCPLGTLRHLLQQTEGTLTEAPEDSLHVLLGTFLTTHPDALHRHLVNFLNPGVRDFCHRYLHLHPEETERLVRKGRAAEQLAYLLSLLRHQGRLPRAARCALRERTLQHLHRCREQGRLMPQDFDILSCLIDSPQLLHPRADETLIIQLLRLESEQSRTPITDSRLFMLFLILLWLPHADAHGIRWESFLLSALHHTTDAFLVAVLGLLAPRLPEPYRNGSAIRPLADMWTKRYLYLAQQMPLEHLCRARDFFRDERRYDRADMQGSQLCGIDLDFILARLRLLIRRRRRQNRDGATWPPHRTRT